MLVVTSLLIALHIILSRFFSINAWNIKIGFAFVPIFVGAYLYGPVFGAIVGAIGDFLGAVLFPIGAYFPEFTLSCALTGLVFGVFLHRKQSAARIRGAVVIDELILSLFVTSFWISILYGSPYLPLVGTRVIQCAILAPVEFVVMGAATKVLSKTKHSLVL